MKRQIFLGAVALFLFAGSLFANQPEYKPGVVLVRFNNAGSQPPSTASKNSIINTIFGTTGTPVKNEYSIVSGLSLVQLPAGVSVESAIASMSNSSSIAYAVPDYKLQLFAVPNDTMFNQLWALRNTGQFGGKAGADIGAVDAWDISTGSKSIIVAVTDTGVDYTHSDLSANMWHNPGEIPNNGIDDDGDGYVDDYYGADTADNDGDPMDNSKDPNHGTHVAGIIGAVGNNSRGVVGVNWNVSIMAVKIADSNGDIFDDAAIRGIQYAVNKGAKVINASWGGFFYAQSLYDAIANARDAGVLFVAAAGNFAFNNDLLPVYPASFDLANIISVMATNNTDQQAYYSNYGLTSVDIGAPGGGGYNDSGDILSTVPGNRYQVMAGTSMASPCVAGACALLLSIDPTLKYSDVKAVLLSTVDRTLPGLCVSGGRMNLYAAANEIKVDSTPPTPNPPLWLIEPTATGWHTASMEAMLASDRSGVQYYFECVNDITINSGWQNDPNYTNNKLQPNTRYGFHFKARDKSEWLNETYWSTTIFTVTSPNLVDNLRPAPNKSLWLIPPKAQRGNIISMQAKGCDESGVRFRFTGFKKPQGSGSSYDSGWQPINSVSFSGSSDASYRFNCQVMDGFGNTTVLSDYADVSTASGTRVLSVPVPYRTIQDAIDESVSGDTVVISPGTYTGQGNRDIVFGGRAITVRSLSPDNSDTVSRTVIDCQDPLGAHQGFIFNRNETPSSILAGLTIINGIALGQTDLGGNGGPGAGGGIQIGLDSSSSPTIRNCVINNCVALGGFGMPGQDGTPGTDANAGTPGNPTADPPVPDGPGTPATPGGDGTDGGNAGAGYGGGIYVGSLSNPVIKNCHILSCWAQPGYAGNGGNGGPGGNGSATAAPPLPGACGGKGGNGGDTQGAYGGGIYVSQNGNPIIVGCSIEDCNVALLPGATVGRGGIGGAPGGNSQFCPIRNGEDGNGAGVADGGGAYFNIIQPVGSINISASTFIRNHAANNGGGIGLPSNNNNQIIFSDCNISGNIADGNGGGVYYQGMSSIASSSSCNITFTGCNIAGNDGSRVGGGITAGDIEVTTNTAITIIDSNIAGNVANEGGGIYLNYMDLTVQEGRIFENSALEGGGINGYGCTFYVNKSDIYNNTATEQSGLGGGIAIWDSTGKILSSTFKGNEAGAFGGAFYITGLTSEPVNINNCLIADNNALYEGGGIACNISGWAKLVNCTLVNNSAISRISGVGGGISCWENFSIIDLDDCILWQNKASYGPQIAVGSIFGSSPDGGGPIADVYVNYSDVEGGAWDAFIENPSYNSVWWNMGSFDADPLFAKTDINEPTYFLSHIAAGQKIDSPCIDAGDSNSTKIRGMIPFVDSLITTRTDLVADTCQVDLGYHYSTDGMLKQYKLSIQVLDQGFGLNGRLKAIGDGDYPFNINDPNTIILNQGIVADLIADPNPGFQVQYWSGTDDDTSNNATNTVTMNADKKVVVFFEPVNMFYLTVNVIGNGTVTPSGTSLRFPGEVVDLTAILGNPSDAIIWLGTDDDSLVTGHNTVTMTGHKTITVRFYTPRILYVGSDINYPTIQSAVDDANTRDIVMITPGTYIIGEAPGGSSGGGQLGSEYPYIRIFGKDITLTSTSPGNPDATSIVGRIDITGVTRNCIIQGLTIRDSTYWGDTIFDPNGEWQRGDPQGSGADGGPGGETLAAGITIHGSASPTIRNCTFTRCVSRGIHGGNGAGGADPAPSIDGITYGGNGGPGGIAKGGAAYCGINSNPLFDNCSFIDCNARGGDGGNGGSGTQTSAPGHGGAWGDKNAPWWENPVLDYWNYTGFGGAAYIDENSTAEFSNCTFTGNTAIGGSCGISGNGPFISGWPYQHYNIPTFGGAIYASTNSKPVFTSCTFANNTADIDGWPTSHRGGNTVNAFATISYGGAVAFENTASPVFNGCSFTANRSTVGGAIWCDESTPLVKDSNFIGNSALHGGAILLSQGKAEIVRSSFNQNTATAASAQGGAIASLGADADIVDCTLTANTSSGDGGGIYVSSKNVEGNDVSSNNTVLIKNCLIADNNAVQGGAGISANWYSDPNIVNCTITGNTSIGGAGGGIYSTYNNYTRILNSIIWGNTALMGREIAVGVPSLPSRVDVFFSDVSRTTDSNFVDQGSILNIDSNSLGVNPNFAGARDYHLSQQASGQTVTSACVDAGSDFASRFGLHKYTTRTDNIPDMGKVDMGYHYSLVETCLEAYFTDDGIVNFGDFVEIANYWLSENCSPANEWCGGRDITFDGSVDVWDMKDLSMCWLYIFNGGGIIIPGGDDKIPPTPNPMTFQVIPHVSGSFTVSMTATTAVDNKPGQIQYMFEETTSNIGGTSSGWQNSTIYTDTGLQANTVYSYRVRARDISGNMTDWSAESSINNVGDVNAPTPAPTIILVAGVGSTIPDDNTSSAQFSWPFGSEWWNKVIVNVTGITDDSNTPMDVRFYCTEDSSLNSENKVRDPNGAVHRINLGQTTDSLGSELDGFRVTYTGSAGNPSITGAFIVYDVDTGQFGGLGSTRHWKARVYDASGNFAESAVVAIGP